MPSEEHNDMINAFRAASKKSAHESLLPILRQQEDRIRELNELAGTDAYINADIFTRRQMTQDLMRRYSDEGITGIRYANGRTVNLDSYAEMVSRTQTKNAFNQGNWNRLQEYGIDLTMISVHYPCSDLCEPYQGRIFSISGGDRQYPSLESAIAGGLYHPNCKHSSSGYVPGVSVLPDRDIGTIKNREMYAAQQRQRQIERNIKKYKRREIASVDPREREKARSLVKKWQAEQRDHISKNPYLRRAYGREQAGYIPRRQTIPFANVDKITTVEGLERAIKGINENIITDIPSTANIETLRAHYRAIYAVNKDIGGFKTRFKYHYGTKSAKAKGGQMGYFDPNPQTVKGYSRTRGEYGPDTIKMLVHKDNRQTQGMLRMWEKMKGVFSGVNEQSVMHHELAHYLDMIGGAAKQGLIKGKKGGRLLMEMGARGGHSYDGYISKYISSKEVFEDAMKNLGISPEMGMTEYMRASNKIRWDKSKIWGEYALKNPAEFVAMAVQYNSVFPGRDKLAAEIYRLVLQRYRRFVP